MSVPIAPGAVSVQTGQILAIALRRFESSTPPAWVIWSVTDRANDYRGGSAYYDDRLSGCSATQTTERSRRVSSRSPRFLSLARCS
jgi:hypothetical protein